MVFLAVDLSKIINHLDTISKEARIQGHLSVKPNENFEKNHIYREVIDFGNQNLYLYFKGFRNDVSLITHVKTIGIFIALFTSLILLFNFYRRVIRQTKTLERKKNAAEKELKRQNDLFNNIFENRIMNFTILTNI